MSDDPRSGLPDVPADGEAHHLDAGHLDASHLDADQLADLAEGLLPPAQTQAAQAHLSRCAGCSARRSDLVALPALLAALPAPGPMPADVVARIDAALRQEAGSPAGATVVPLAAERHRRAGRGRRVPTGLLQAAAALVTVAAIGGAVIASHSWGGSDSTASQRGGIAAQSTGSAASAATRFTESGHAYSAASLEGDTHALLAGGLPEAVRSAATADSQVPAQAPAAGGTTRFDAPSRAAAEACTAALAADKPRTALAVDKGTFAGKPVLVVVLPSVDEPSRVDVFVVGTSCRPKDEQLRSYLNAARP